ncbi:MAG: hypothetical protein JXA25_03550 [Anaerolineales bacterium]|nr:hypothetical protein [Anaerolineales bacterium]
MSDKDKKANEPLLEFVEFSQTELERVQTSLKEIDLLVEQSQGEVDKLAQRNAGITARLHQIQAQFETVPREDIRSIYETAQDTQQRLFTMRGQLEKLQSDQIHLRQYADYIRKSLLFLEGGSARPVEEETPIIESEIEHIIQAQEDERRKISRQVHDGPAQSLSNFILQTEIALRLFDTDIEKARQELQNLKLSATETFSNVRDFIFDLRPMMLDDLGLVPTAKRYVEAFKDKTGIEVSCVVTGKERRLESHREVLVFRGIQELLANIRDHAQATQGKVSIFLDEDSVVSTVEDNGKGFDVDPYVKGTINEGGLYTLRERLNQVGGTLNLECPAEGGTRVSFTIPTH